MFEIKKEKFKYYKETYYGTILCLVDIINFKDDYEWLYSVMNDLSKIEKTFLSLRFGQAEEKPVSTIAKELGLNKYQTLRLQNRVLSKLRTQVAPMLLLS